MPTDINVADGKLADWHRFDAKSTAVVKDRHVLMSNADSADNAREQITTIWTKLGGTDTPPRVTYFTRDDMAANTAGEVPAAPPKPSLNTTGLTSLTINLSFVNSLGGAAPTSVRVRAVEGVNTATTDTSFTWPWPTTASVTGLTSGTTYAVSYRYTSPLGNGAFSPIETMTTQSLLLVLSILPMLMFL